MVAIILQINLESSAPKPKAHRSAYLQDLECDIDVALRLLNLSGHPIIMNCTMHDYPHLDLNRLVEIEGTYRKQIHGSSLPTSVSSRELSVTSYVLFELHEGGKSKRKYPSTLSSASWITGSCSCLRASSNPSWSSTALLANRLQSRYSLVIPVISNLVG